jgi:hypothetical protein
VAPWWTREQTPTIAGMPLSGVHYDRPLERMPREPLLSQDTCPTYDGRDSTSAGGSPSPPDAGLRPHTTSTKILAEYLARSDSGGVSGLTGRRTVYQRSRQGVMATARLLGRRRMTR